MMMKRNTHIRIINRNLTPILLEEPRNILLQRQPHPLSQFVRLVAPIDRGEIIWRQVRRGSEESSTMITE